ncbi:MAG: patatin-like phospholipase family protein, partial [Candidatus Cloacimonetes bacterium]|nr:patatin-like phospholipase family protein [Candidatus Cloacimonadota bacterium]
MLKKLTIILFSLSITLIALADERPKIGLVLSGGGAKGIAHIGVLKVLEEYGIKPDYISGTSMGAIIGALYSIGYTPDELESLIFEQNWPSLMTDKRERINLSLIELENDSKYQLNFPIDNWTISLPSGLVNGQNVITLLSSLTIPVHGIENFNELPIPFCCVGTDLETGKSVVMDHGTLSEAIRGSMSIPTAFSPSEWEEYLLLDGGLVNNFPVEEVRKMGAEIIIGVDISQSFAKRKELNNMVSVITQAISFRGYASTEEQRQYCDILIEPNLEDYNLLSFDKLRDIYNIGEYAARQKVPEIQALASILKEYNRKRVKFPSKFKDDFLIKGIKFEGLKSIPTSAVRGWININTPAVVSVSKIESSIQRLISSRNF